MKQSKTALYHQVLQSVVDFLSARANPELVVKYSRYFKDGYGAWGNNDSDLKACMEHLEKQFPSLGLDDVIPLGLILFANGKYEAGSVAIRLIQKFKKTFTRATFAGVKSWYDTGIGNWAHSDVICSLVISEFFKQNIITYKDFADWKTSPSKWTRRAVPVSLLEIRKTADPLELLNFLDSMMLDEVREVHQGLGWFLRELWKLHPQPVEAFLLKYRNTAARLIFQYATEKMSKEQKERFRKEKSAKNTD